VRCRRRLTAQPDRPATAALARRARACGARWLPLARSLRSLLPLTSFAGTPLAGLSLRSSFASLTRCLRRRASRTRRAPFSPTRRRWWASSLGVSARVLVRWVQWDRVGSDARGLDRWVLGIRVVRRSGSWCGVVSCVLGDDSAVERVSLAGGGGGDTHRVPSGTLAIVLFSEACFYRRSGSLAVGFTGNPVCYVSRVGGCVLTTPLADCGSFGPRRVGGMFPATRPPRRDWRDVDRSSACVSSDSSSETSERSVSRPGHEPLTRRRAR
jgi:hypothetical protein